VDDLRDVPARDALELPAGKGARIDAHPAFRPAERQADDGAFPRHPHGERRHLAEVDVEGVADAALRGPHRQEMLDAIAEDRSDRLVVVAAKGKRHHVGALRAAQPCPEVGVEPHALGGPVELRDRELVHGGIPLELGVERGDGHALD
jgi:hypothetical protein